MSELIENTVELVKQFNEDIKSDLSSKGFNFSNDTYNSLRVNSFQFAGVANIQSLGASNIEYLDRGSGPWDDPTKFRKLGWILSEEVSDWAFGKAQLNPYAVAHSIAHKGNSVYRKPSSGLMIGVKIKRLQKTIKEQAPKWAKQDLLIKIKANKFE